MKHVAASDGVPVGSGIGRWARSGGPRSCLRSAGAPLFLAMATANATNFAFHGVAGHLLEGADYGGLASLLAILLALSVPAGAVQAALTGEVARRREAGEPLRIGPLVRAFGLAGTAAAVLLALAAPAIAAYLHLSSPLPVMLVGLYLVPLALGVVPWAFLCGERRFGLLAVAVLAGASTRLVLGAALMGAGTGLSGALAATVTGELVLAGVLLVAAGRGSRVGAVRLGLDWRSSVRAVNGLVGLWLLLGLDTLLARHYLAPAEAGRYAAMAVLARVALFLPQAVTLVALPSFASADAARAARALRIALAAVLGLGLGAALLLIAAAPHLIPLLFGSSFEVSVPVLSVLALTSAGAGVLNLLLQFHLARGSRFVHSAWLGVAAVPLAVGVWHAGPLALAAVLAAAVAVSVVVALTAALARPALPTRPAMQRARLDASAALDLTVVVPFHNPGELLRPNLLNLVAALRGAGVSFEVITVADGCTDGSPETIADLDPRLVRRLTLDHNCGKGEALRIGLHEGRGRYLGFIDSDGDLDPELWQPFLELMRIYRPDAVLGSKRHPLSEVETPAVRRIYSWGYQRLNRLLFRLPVLDTQVGIKLFRREVLIDVLPRTVERGFVFDLELLVVARRMGYRRFLEAPVVLRHGGPSTVRLSSVWAIFRSTLALAWRLRVRGSYNPPGAPGRPVAAVWPREVLAPARVPVERAV